MTYYHVGVFYYNKIVKDIDYAYELDLSKGELMELIVRPYLAEHDFICGGRAIHISSINEITITESDEPSAELIPKLRSRIHREEAASLGVKILWHDPQRLIRNTRNVTRDFLRHASREDETKQMLSKNVFIVHGRDDKPKLELARMLEKLGFDAIILSEQPNKGRTIIEKLEQETIDVGFVFAVLTPDDVGSLYESVMKYAEGYDFSDSQDRDLYPYKLLYGLLKPRARQNVILELGYFVGKIGRNRVCCLYKGDVELPSDIHGVLFKKFDKSVEECYKGILDELKAAGYEIRI